MRPLTNQIKEKPWKGWALFGVTVIVVFLLGLLASEIVERRAEAVFAYTPAAEYSQYEPRNEVWGENFPRQYESFLKTKDDGLRTKYNGSAFIDELEEYPRMVVLWAGYGFSKDYTQARGHYYAVEDIRKTLRTGAPTEDKDGPMPNTCWTCKSPDVPRVMSEVGPAEFYRGSWKTRGSQIVNPIGCADCHDAETMNLRITRPALAEAFERRGEDVEKQPHQEMRSLVCAQCHVEYYFDKRVVEGVSYLTFPWDRGLTVDSAEAYYDAFDFADWTHPISGTPMLKAQHPGYEIFRTGVHYKRGVACADCHMPYRSEGGRKFTDHHIRSPLADVNASCQVCHREETERLLADVYERQDIINEGRVKLEKLLVRAHIEAGEAITLGASQNEMKPIRNDIRHAQWRWDYAVASHGASFHSPLEVSRIISSGIELAQEARVKTARLLVKLGREEPPPYPDIATKAKAQKFIGIEVEELEREKERFLSEMVPQWEDEAAKREADYEVKYFEE